MQSISNVLGQFGTGPMQLLTLLQDANKLLQIWQELETINTDLMEQHCNNTVADL